MDGMVCYGMVWYGMVWYSFLVLGAIMLAQHFCCHGMVWYGLMSSCGMWYVVCLCSDLEPSVKVIVGLRVVVKSIPLEVRAQPSLFNGYIYGSFSEHSYFLFLLRRSQ